jgi:hypothetical protein
MSSLQYRILLKWHHQHTVFFSKSGLQNKKYSSYILFQLNSDLGEAVTTFAPAPPPAAADNTIQIEEVPPRSTEAAQPPATEAVQLATEAAQQATEVAQPATEAAQPATEAAQTTLAVPQVAVTEPAFEEPQRQDETVAPAAPTESQFIPVTEADVAAVAGGEAATEAAAPLLRDVPTPSVDFGLIQEVTGVQRDEAASS